MPHTRVLELHPLYPILYASATKIYASATKRAHVYDIPKQLKIWPHGLSRGQQSLRLKFLYTSRFELAAKSKEGMMVAVIEGNDDCGQLPM